MNRDRLLDNTRLLEQAQGLEQAQNTKQKQITRQKQTTRQAQTTKQAWIVMRLVLLDALVTFIKVWAMAMAMAFRSGVRRRAHWAGAQGSGASGHSRAQHTGCAEGLCGHSSPHSWLKADAD